MADHEYSGVHRVGGTGDDAPHGQDLSHVAEAAIYAQSAPAEAQGLTDRHGHGRRRSTGGDPPAHRRRSGIDPRAPPGRGARPTPSCSVFQRASLESGTDRRRS